MQTLPNKKISHIFAIATIIASIGAWLTPANYFQAALENEFIISIKKKLTEYNSHSPEDRMYVQLDKPFYQPGDAIWLSAYIRDGLTLKSSQKSDIVYLELISPKGTIEKKIKVIAKNGKAAGDFNLDKEAIGGLYKIRAYTQWMKNESKENYFEKEIQVQNVVLPNLKMKLDFEKKAFGAGDEVIAKLELNTNENKPLTNYKVKFVANLNGVKLMEKTETTDENGMRYLKFNLPKELKTNDGLLNVMIDYNGSTESISRSIPIVLNTIQLLLLPEGGDLVSGLENRVAFKAVNEFNKPADIEGVVLDENGHQVTTLNSFHQGMGSFNLIPKLGSEYMVKITKPEGIKETFKLPESLKRGYNLQVDNSTNSQVAICVNTTESEELALVAQMRGKMYYSTLIKSKPGPNKFIFSTENFPIGVCQITLFDSKGIARSERLAFVNKHKQLSISVQTEKEKYLPREKVKMTLTVKDERGLPMPANLSMSVVNDQLLSYADDKSGNILSQLLLQQDLKEKIEEPAFYFNKKEAKADKALDLVMMTSGWRRFTWEKLIENDLPVINYFGERALVGGTIFSSESGKPLPGVKVKVQNGIEMVSDQNGKFLLEKLDLSSPVTLAFNHEGYGSQSKYIQDYTQNLSLYMYKSYPNTYYKTSSAKRSKHADFDEMEIQEGVPAMNLAGAANGAVLAEPAMMAPVDKMQKEKAPMLDANIKANKKVIPAGGKLIPSEDRLVKEEQAKKEVIAFGSLVKDQRDEKFGKMDDLEDHNDNFKKRAQQVVKVYYRAREFYAPTYQAQENVETRTDFRNTIYWNPNIEVGYSGKKTIEFFTSDDITSFRTTVEGMSSDGSIGRVEKNIFTQLPFAMSTKIPVEVATEDFVSIPLTLKNNTNGPLGGIVSITAPDGLKELTSIPSIQTIMPGAAKTIYLDYKVLDKIGEGEFTISFKACGLGDAFTQKIKIAPKGFPVQASFSSQDVEKEYSFEIQNLVNGSLKATFTAFPNVVSDLMKGVEGILREPYGCFEQTSCSAYPNAMVLDYLKSTDSDDTKSLSKAKDLLDRGYKRLTTFEASEKGYEWFGANPAHEGLTAYGIMEFVDMKKAGQDVDQKMLDRTANWLMKQKDGKGGFAREKHAYHDFGRISDDVLNSYIVYALAEAGYTDIKKEFESSYKKALELKDPYMLAMMTNAAYSLNDQAKADKALELLLKSQAKNGSFTGSSHSITYSQGQSLTIETTALSIMAMIKANGKQGASLNNAVQFLTSSRSGSGVFSSTQGTILALKSLTEYAKFSKKTTEDGKIAIYVDGKKVIEKEYKAGDKGAISAEGLEEFLKGEGKHQVKVKYIGVKTPLPYSLAINWSTSLPKSDSECAIDLQTKLATNTTNVGETVRLSSIITNKKSEEVPSTMAIIGIPAGFSVQAWQLKELQEKKVFDYYEIKGNNIAIYYRGMGPNAKKEINLDLKAEMPGVYDAPASTAYLYYMNEFKTWTATDKITIKKTS